MPLREGFARVREKVGARVVGQHEAVRLGFLTLLCSGHSLVEGVPGVAKTVFVKRLAAASELR